MREVVTLLTYSSVRGFGSHAGPALVGVVDIVRTSDEAMRDANEGGNRDAMARLEVLFGTARWHVGTSARWHAGTLG